MDQADAVFDWKSAVVVPLTFAIVAPICGMLQLGRQAWPLALMACGFFVILGCPLCLLVWYLNNPHVSLSDDAITVEPSLGMSKRSVPLAQ